jgi:hypothetical protein
MNMRPNRIPANSEANIVELQLSETKAVVGGVTAPSISYPTPTTTTTTATLAYREPVAPMRTSSWGTSKVV